jgi:peptide deformylase
MSPATLPIQTGNKNPILRTVSKPVPEVTKKTLKLIKEMEATLELEKGVGIAAPQVGENARIFLALLDQKHLVAMINPEFLNHNEILASAEEGCLSLPGEWGQVERYTELTIRFLDTKGRENTLKLKGFNARVVQHEMDHLDGILFTDHVKQEANFLQMPKLPETERL